MSGREIGNRRTADTAAKAGRKPPCVAARAASDAINQNGVGMRLNTIQFPTA